MSSGEGEVLNSAGTVRAETIGSVLVITIDRPEVRNAVDRQVADGIEAGVDRLESREDLRAGVLTGAGTAFSSGADLRLLASGAPLPYTDRGAFGGLVTRERTKPLIAAADGPALAGGCELALACDIIVASEAARFGIPEVKLGLYAGGGGLVRLAQRLPTSVAMEMALTGAAIDADRAHDVGLVSQLVPAGQARARAVELATAIAVNPVTSVVQSRRVVRIAAEGTAAEAWAANEDAGEIVQSGEHFQQGPQAFLDKRSPS